MAIRLNRKELITFQGVWDGFNCCSSKSGKNELFLHFLPNSNYPLPNSQGWRCVGGVMTERVGREMLDFTHHFGPVR